MFRVLLVSIFAFSLNAFAKNTDVAHCAYTNDGDGGDEGYEFTISVNDKGVFTAAISVIDPGGERVFKKIVVAPTQTGNGSGFAGKDFVVNFYSYLPTVGEDGLIFSYFEHPDDFGGTFKGGTLCSGSAVR